jgi:spore germination protein YaaH
MKIRILLVLGVIFVGCGIFLLSGNWGKESIITPLVKKSNHSLTVNRDYKIYGFLPSWMIGKTSNYCDEVSHLVFLGIEANEKGDLIWDAQAKKVNNEIYLKQKEDFKKCEGRNILGIKLFDDDKISELVATESAKVNLVEQVKKTVKEGNFDGVNIDFEYQGNPTAVLNDEFNDLLLKFKQAEVGEITVDVFANTIIKGDSSELRTLINNTDSLIVMAYDFHRPGSNYAGPVAPVDAPAGERNIMEILQKLVDGNLPRNKIILAYPLYGYEWKTNTNEFGSKVIKGYSALASYKRMKELLDNKDRLENFKLGWDETSMSPWVSYTEKGENKQIYFENTESLKRKVKLVADSQLGGVGFWALGYEGENKEVWNEVEKIIN